MTSKSATVLAVMVAMTFATAAAAFAQNDAFQIRYAANLNLGDSVVNLTNAGTSGSPAPAGNLCANVYVFDPTEQMVACCSCLVTPNGLNSLSARRDLIGNTLTPAVPTSILIKLLATAPAGGSCNAGAPGALAPGLRAWGTTLHAMSPSNGSSAGRSTPGFGGSAKGIPVSQTTAVALTETAFSEAALSPGELLTLTSNCSFIQAAGSGFGICRSCRLGGL